MRPDEVHRKHGTLDSSRARMQVLLNDDSYYTCPPTGLGDDGGKDANGFVCYQADEKSKNRESKIRNFHLIH